MRDALNLNRVPNARARNGKRRDLPVAVIVGRDYKPFPGVTWILPRTIPSLTPRCRTMGSHFKSTGSAFFQERPKCLRSSMAVPTLRIVLVFKPVVTVRIGGHESAYAR
jgi:hypothetical protein